MNTIVVLNKIRITSIKFRLIQSMIKSQEKIPGHPLLPIKVSEVLKFSRRRFSLINNICTISSTWTNLTYEKNKIIRIFYLNNSLELIGV